MRMTLGLSILMFVAGSAGAETPEALSVHGGASFDRVTESNVIAALENALAPTPACPAALQAAPSQPAHTVAVSGSVTLSGSDFVSVPEGAFEMTLEGRATLSDASGDITSNLTMFRVSAFLTRSFDFAGGYVEPSVTIAMYRDGQYIGDATVRGSIYVSGPMHGDWADVQGTGQLQGMLTINPIDAPVPLKR